MVHTLSPAGVFSSYLTRAGEKQHRFPLLDLALRVGLIVKGVFAALAAVLANLFDLTTHLQPPLPQPSPGMTDFAGRAVTLLTAKGFKDPALFNTLLTAFMAFRDQNRHCDLTSVKNLVGALHSAHPREASTLANYLGYTVREEERTMGSMPCFTVTTHLIYTPIIRERPAPARQ